MPFNSVISRTDAEALIPEEVSNEILGLVPQESTVLKLARPLGRMSRAQTRLPVWDALALAYFVNGDTGLKQTTKLAWANKYIDAEEIAVIVPIPQSVLDDTSYDIWGNIKPRLVEAMGVAIDKAVFYGTNIPATWTTDLGGAGLQTVIAAASQDIHLSAYTDMYEAILGETAAGVSGLFGLVEADGFMVTGSVCSISMKRKLRNTRDAMGQPIFGRAMQGPFQYELDGAPCLFPVNGSIDATYLAIAGQWNQLVYAMRQDITYKILDQAVIQDASGAIVYNLAQQDMVALRAVMRLGVALPNPINAVNETDATRCPFAYMEA